MTTLEHKKELANAITHGLGIVFYLIGVPILVAYAVKQAQFPAVVTVGVYSFGLLMVFISSTLYHSVFSPTTKHILRIFDHISIFLLIGGTYTVFIQHCFSATFAFYFLLCFWSLILLGIIFKVFFTGKYKLISTLFYVVLGLISVFYIKDIAANIPTASLVGIIAGGLCYLAGVFFYMSKKLTYHHAIWHLFVFAGSLGHYIAIMYLFI